MGMTQQAVAKAYDAAAEKLVAVYRKWEYGEITVEYEEEESEAA